jgi:hypothetical protein
MSLVNTFNSGSILKLKHEAIDRLHSVANDFPKYKEMLETLTLNFTIDDMLFMMNRIDRDAEFKRSLHYMVYNEYFDEIEELTHKCINC